MENLGNRIRLTLSVLLYLMFHLRIGSDIISTTMATGGQLLLTAPYTLGVSYLIIATLQYMADGEKLPWDRKLKIFLAIGILAGLIFGIYDYTQGAAPKP